MLRLKPVKAREKARSIRDNVSTTKKKRFLCVLERGFGVGSEKRYYLSDKKNQVFIVSVGIDRHQK
jgi:hypothetical protein